MRDRELLTSTEAADYMGLKHRHIKRLVGERVIPYVAGADGVVRFERAVLDEAMTYPRVMAMRVPPSPDNKIWRYITEGEEM